RYPRLPKEPCNERAARGFHHRGGRLPPPALHRRGDGGHPDPHLLLAEHQGARRLLHGRVRRQRPRHPPGAAGADPLGLHDRRRLPPAQRVPIHLGSMIGAVDAVTARYGPQGIAPGDMFVANDPYSGGGSHLPDINVVAPVFWQGRIVAFVANIAHHADVGGMVPGSEAAVCRSIFQEGLRLPPVRIMRAGEINRDVFDIILLNSRTPDERNGDPRAQFASNVTGIRAVEGLFARYGAETEPAIEAYLEFTRRRFAAAVGRIRPGTYRVEDFLDGNAPGETARIALALTIEAERLSLEFEGSAPQLTWARNIPHQALIATVYTVAKSLLDPDVPANAGYFDSITIRAPKGTVVQPEAPAPVGCRSISCGVLGD